jgi:hypothetical protein
MKTHILALLTLLWLAPSAARANQELLASAKSLYESASYEAALSELSAIDSKEIIDTVDTYRALCLLGLGRTRDAERALEVIVARKPLLMLSESEYSPRLVAMFRDVRRRALPGAAQQLYSAAKTDYDNKNYAAAATGFKQMIQVIADVDARDQSARLADLKELAGGFLTLAETKMAPQPAPAPPAAPVALAAPVAVATSGVLAASGMPAAPGVPPASGVPTPSGGPAASDATAAPEPPAVAPKLAVAGSVLYTLLDRDVTPPVVVTQQIPAWRFAANLPDRAFRGRLEIVIDESGAVETARLEQPIWPAYDSLLVRAARSWRYQPAVKEGKPVRFRRILDINVDPKLQLAR